MKVLVIEIPETAFPLIRNRVAFPGEINRVTLLDHSNEIAAELYVSQFVSRIMETKVTLEG